MVRKQAPRNEAAIIDRARGLAELMIEVKVEQVGVEANGQHSPIAMKRSRAPQDGGDDHETKQ